MNETTADNERQGWEKSLTRITSYMSVCLCPRVRGPLIVLQGDQPVEIASLTLNIEYENVGMIDSADLSSHIRHVARSQPAW